MKLRLGIILVTGLLMAACGSSDSESDANAEPAAADDASEEETPGDDTPENDTPENDAADDSDGDMDDGDTDDGDTDDGDTDDGDTDDGDMGDSDADADTDGSGDSADTDDGDTDDDDDTIVVSSFDDIPGECIDLMGQFLRDIEPEVSAIDWQTATIDELEAMGTAVETPSIKFDEASAAAGCDQYTIGVDDDQSIQFAIEVAQREAPGTVGWLEFIATFTGLGAGSETGDGGSASGEGPTDCAGMLDLLRDLADEYGTMTQVPLAELGELSTLLTDLTTTCTLEELDQFASDPVISAFLDG